MYVMYVIDYQVENLVNSLYLTGWDEQHVDDNVTGRLVMAEASATAASADMKDVMAWVGQLLV